MSHQRTLKKCLNVVQKKCLIIAINIALEDPVSTSSSDDPRVSHNEQNKSSIVKETHFCSNIQQICNYSKKCNRKNQNPDPYLELKRHLLDLKMNNQRSILTSLARHNLLSEKAGKS